MGRSIIIISIMITHSTMFCCQLSNPTGAYLCMHTEIISDRLPNYINATKAIFERFKIAGYFLNKLHIYKNPYQNITSDRFEYEAIVLDTVGEPCEYKTAISVFINFSNLSSHSRWISANKNQ